ESLEIRPARAGEEREVCDLITRVFDEFVGSDFTQEGVDEFYEFAAPDAMADRMRSGEIVLIAENREGIVGMIELRGLDHIAMLFVERRGAGIGRRLVEEALKTCHQQDPASEGVTVHASRYAAPIYRKLGFEETGPERTENGITYLPMMLRFERAER
ncbi:MAG: GNAT family N-acetyltransferase, partial [Thermoanaerobaculia bacterium]|nr:GNAT family N-acetyltransferase [Thermoanaerobaculia bacterium]